MCVRCVQLKYILKRNKNKKREFSLFVLYGLTERINRVVVVKDEHESEEE